MLRVLVNAEEAHKFSRGGLAGYDFDVEVVAFPVAPCSHLEKVGVGIVVMLALLVRRREVPRLSGQIPTDFYGFSARS